MSFSVQAKLLRVLEEGTFMRLGGTRTIQVDVRILAATNKVLKDSVTRGEFRDDLFYRLNVLPIFIPPLRDRKEDIVPLALDIMKRFNTCLLYTSDAADEEDSVDLGGRRIIKN